MQSTRLTTQEKVQLVKEGLAKLKEENEALKLEIKGLRSSLANALARSSCRLISPCCLVTRPGKGHSRM